MVWLVWLDEILREDGRGDYRDSPSDLGSSAAASSARVMVAVPSFATTRPAATLAR